MRFLDSCRRQCSASAKLLMTWVRETLRNCFQLYVQDGGINKLISTSEFRHPRGLTKIVPTAENCRIHGILRSKGGRWEERYRGCVAWLTGHRSPFFVWTLVSAVGRRRIVNRPAQIHRRWVVRRTCRGHNTHYGCQWSGIGGSCVGRCFKVNSYSRLYHFVANLLQHPTYRHKI
jgi:hypothetical protein